MKFSGKMCFEIILNVRKNPGFTLSLEDTFFKNHSEGRGGGGGGGPFDPPQAILGVKSCVQKTKNIG